MGSILLRRRKHTHFSTQPAEQQLTILGSQYFTFSDTAISQDIFGDNYYAFGSWAFFLSDEPADVGSLATDYLGNIYLIDQVWDFTTSDCFSEAGDLPHRSWLLVDDSASFSAVPNPAAAFLFAPALLGFMGLRRKAHKSKA